MSRGAIKYPGLNLGSAHGKDDEIAERLIFGFWIFLMSDAILFGLVFATYVTSLHATAGGPRPHDLYDIRSIFIETLLLLASSFTFGLASLALKYDRGRVRLVGWLLTTLVLGVMFLSFEVHDLNTMSAGGAIPSRSGFLSAFFDLVPLHGLHVSAGCIWLISLVGQIARHGLDAETKVGIMRLALFWHFLDIVWIGIFSVVYLGGLT